MDDYASSSVSAFFQKFGLVIILGILGAGILVYGLIQYLPTSSNPDISFDSPQLTVTPIPEQKLMVDISGAVNSPGVYAFSSNDRIVDALKKAGGLSKNADASYIAKAVNEAMKLTDGMKIYIPKVGEIVSSSLVGNASASSVHSGSSSTGSTVLGAQTGLISINSATEAQLDSLPGVGAVTAGKIISGRPYGSVEELLSKKVVSASVFGKIKDKVGL
jgi:competence protein ComEA